MRVVCAFVLCWLLLGAGAARAQRAHPAVVVPESIRVGDVFHAAVRLELPDGAELLTPDTLELPPDVENAGRPEIRVDSAGNVRLMTVVYPLAAWRPGSYALPPVTLHVRSPQGDRQFRVDLPGFAVTSVLPADTAGIEMKGLKDVWGPNRIWWPWLLALLLAIAAVLFYVWWRRRHRPEAPVVIVPPVPARDTALERLAALRRSGLLERGELKPYYAELSEVMRHYAATVHASYTVDLTTIELAQRIRVTDVSLLDLIRVLGDADLVKFARARPPADVAIRDLDAAQSWIERTSVVEAEAAPVGSTEPRRVA